MPLTPLNAVNPPQGGSGIPSITRGETLILRSAVEQPCERCTYCKVLSIGQTCAMCGAPR